MSYSHEKSERSGASSFLRNPLDEWPPFLQSTFFSHSRFYINQTQTKDNFFLDFSLSHFHVNQTQTKNSLLQTIPQQLISHFAPHPHPFCVCTRNTRNLNIISEIYSADGRLVYRGSDKIINTSEWSKGLYEVVVRTRDDFSILDEIKLIVIKRKHT